MKSTAEQYDPYDLTDDDYSVDAEREFKLYEKILDIYQEEDE